MIKVLSLDELPEDVARRAKLRGWNYRAEEGESGAWGATAAGAVSNLETIRQQADMLREQAQS